MSETTAVLIPLATVTNGLRRRAPPRGGEGRSAGRAGASLQAVIDGSIVDLAGQVAQNAAGQSVTEQTRDILGIIDDLLALPGTDRSRLLTAQIWLGDVTAFDEMNAVWDAWVPPDDPPARA